MDKAELLLEARRRGILPPEMSAALDEAIKRGLVKESSAAADTRKFEEKIKKDAAPTKLERFGRGFEDVRQGVTQGYLKVKDMLTGGAEADAYTAEGTEELERYERNRGPDAGMDLMRLGGNLVATAPAMMGGPAGLGARVALGSAQGGAASGVMFTPEGESKVEQIAKGAAFGGAIPLAGAAVRAAGGPAVRKVTDMVRGPQAPQQVAGELQIKLQQQGIDWNGLTREVQESLVADAQKALSAGGTLDDAMLKNKALIESVGAKPTRASVSRSPEDWRAEHNLRGIDATGGAISKRHQENAAALTDYLQKLRTGTGGKTGTALEAGESAIGAIKAQDKAKGEAVGALYDAYRAHGAKDAAVPEKRLMDSLTGILDEIGQDNIPAAVQSRLKEFGFLGGERTRNLTIQQADTFNRLLNANRPTHGPGQLAVGRLQSALNESLLDIPEKGASEALLTARKAAAQRFAEQRAGKGIEAAIDDVSPDRFVQKFVVGADTRDLKAMLAELKKSPQGMQAVSDVKGHILDNLLLKATGATNADDVAGKAFSGARFGKALDDIAPEKLHALFKPDEIGALRQLQKASKLLTEEVPFSDVNHSKTSQALANLFLKLGNTPLLGQIVSPIIGTAKLGLDWVKDANARKEVAEALLGSAAKSAERKARPVGRLERLAPGGVGAAVNQPSNEE